MNERLDDSICQISRKKDQIDKKIFMNQTHSLGVLQSFMFKQ